MKVQFIYKGTVVKKIRLLKNAPQEIIIGRSAAADINFTNIPSLSSKHLQLFYDGDSKFFITDLGSRNGTFINGKKLTALQTVSLNNSDKVQLCGNSGIEIRLTPSGAEEHPNSAEYLEPEYDESTSYSNIMEKFKNKSEITVGRSSTCDVVLDYSFISREHATIRRRDNDTFLITDLGSLNGTFVNGKKIKKAEFNREDDIYLGRLKISLRGYIKDLSKEIAISVDRITKKFPNGKIGIHETSFEIPSRSLLAIMGPSGCGKSTLLKALNGDSPVTAGKVFICGLELNQNFDFLKTQIGYVPQDDIVHRELTVEQSLRFAAKLRMNNANDTDIDGKIDSVLRSLNIEMIKDSIVGKISGGQRKRVSIAVELLTDPLILFLDEPTSPLDPETIENFLESLQTLSKNGTTIIMVTHKPEDLYYMHTVIFMAEGGHLVYFNDAKSYLSYFNVANAPKVYSNLVGKNSKVWVDKYKSLNPAKLNTDSKAQSLRASSSTNYLQQYFWLTSRYFSIKLNDKFNSALMVGQAPLIAFLVLMIFSSIYQAVPFLLTISALWFGVINAAREVVAELPIYKRERMFNQAILPYIFSKLSVLGSFAAVQCFIFTCLMVLGYSNCSSDDSVCVTWNNPLLTFLWMLFISIIGTLMGLLLSAVVSTTEKVMTFVPIVLIPQLMLAGIIAKIDRIAVEYISYFTVSRWGTEGFCNIQEKVITKTFMLGEFGIAPVPVKSDAVSNLIANYHEDYIGKDIFGELTATLKLDFTSLSALGLIFFIILYFALKSKDPIKITR
jgi:ABC-type multidrug transport system ATPase subunit